MSLPSPRDDRAGPSHAAGVRAVTSAEAVTDVDVVIMSTPLGAIPKIAPLLVDVPADTILIDTSN